MQFANHLQFQHQPLVSMPPANPQHVVQPADCFETLLSDPKSSFNSSEDSDDSEESDTVDLNSLSTPVPANLYGRFRSESGASSGSQGSAALNRIEFLEVTRKIKRDGVNFYVVDVYLHRSELQRRSSESAYVPTAASRISGAGLLDFMLSEREPDYQVEHRFTDFRELKNALQVVAEAHADQCAHCQTLSAYLSHSENQSWTIKRLVKTAASRQELLAKFINGVLSLTSDSDANNRLCLANEEVLEMVEAFLRRRFAVSLGII